jgi:hypothetical protein
MSSIMEHERSKEDSGLRRMLTWVMIALIATIALAIIVVELTMRWLNR